MFGIMIFWLGNINCVVKIKKWIAFPKSRYVNSDPERKYIVKCNISCGIF